MCGFVAPQMLAADILQAFQEAGLQNKDKIAAVGKKYVSIVVLFKRRNWLELLRQFVRLNQHCNGFAPEVHLFIYSFISVSSSLRVIEDVARWVSLHPQSETKGGGAGRSLNCRFVLFGRSVSNDREMKLENIRDEIRKAINECNRKSLV
jgi:hypothetical protein